MTESQNENELPNSVEVDMNKFEFKPVDVKKQMEEFEEMFASIPDYEPETKASPVQNSQTFNICSPITLEKEFLTKDAYSVLRTDELFTLLQNIQSDVNVFHLDIPNTDAFLEVDQEIWKQILTLRRIHHYDTLYYYPVGHDISPISERYV